MIVFLTDTLSILQALTNKTLPHLAKALQLLSNNCRLTLQWIPVHCEVPTNEQADTLAKQGAQTVQPCAYVSYQEMPSLPKRLGCLAKMSTTVSVGQSKCDNGEIENRKQPVESTHA